MYDIEKDKQTVYKNLISQTMDPTKSHKEKLEVYPLFHFIPGDPNAESAKRKDGQTNPFNTTPNSPNANRIIDSALKTNDFYQIGMASHAYVDTWAHQNFVGFQSDFNAFSGFTSALLPNIGHADAKTQPDQPRLIWDDERLVNSTVINKDRFLEAARHLFGKLRMLADSSCSTASLETDWDSLLIDLDSAISGSNSEDEPSNERLAGYSALAEKSEYGGAKIPEYKKDIWIQSAIEHTVKFVGNPNRQQQRIDVYGFKPGHETSDWFKFQEAVKAYAERTKAILCETPAIADQYLG